MNKKTKNLLIFAIVAFVCILAGTQLYDGRFHTLFNTLVVATYFLQDKQ